VVQEVPYFRENAGMALPLGAVTSTVIPATTLIKMATSDLTLTFLFVFTCPPPWLVKGLEL